MKAYSKNVNRPDEDSFRMYFHFLIFSPLKLYNSYNDTWLYLENSNPAISGCRPGHKGDFEKREVALVSRGNGGDVECLSLELMEGLWVVCVCEGDGGTMPLLEKGLYEHMNK